MISLMDELFIKASKEIDDYKMRNETGFLHLVNEFLYVDTFEINETHETNETFFSISNQINNEIVYEPKTRPNHNMLTLHKKNRPDSGKLGLIDSLNSSDPQKKYALLA